MPLRDDTGYEEPGVIRDEEVPKKIALPGCLNELITARRVAGTEEVIQKERKKAKPSSRQGVKPKMAFGRRALDTELSVTGQSTSSKRTPQGKRPVVKK